MAGKIPGTWGTSCDWWHSAHGGTLTAGGTQVCEHRLHWRIMEDLGLQLRRSEHPTSCVPCGRLFSDVGLGIVLLDKRLSLLTQIFQTSSPVAGKRVSPEVTAENKRAFAGECVVR